MKTEIEMKQMYFEEKNMVTGGHALEDHLFPSYQQWKVDYLKEYHQTHVTVSSEQADDIIEQAIKEADDQFVDIADDQEQQVVTQHSKPNIEQQHKSVTTVGKSTSNKTKTSHKKSHKCSSKSEKAQRLFDKYSHKERSWIIQRLQTQCGLTKHGANTYYYKMRKAASM